MRPIMRSLRFLLYAFVLPFLYSSCNAPKENDETTDNSDMEITSRIPVILDTDANNELDDQHAMAYLFLNKGTFDVKGVTVNATKSGGNIDSQYEEAFRVMKLCAVESSIPLFKGADKSFKEISPDIENPQYDGHAAVDFIQQTAGNYSATEKLVIIAVGKLTNIALAMQKDSALLTKVRLVWLGSNYPDPGEYNQNNDTVAMNYLLNTPLEFEMVTVRGGKPSGTDAVRLTKQEVLEKMGGLGPTIAEPVEGRHGGKFTTFGDYSISLFENIDYHGDPPSRALYDMAAVAVVKNPNWAKTQTIPAPILINGVWVERPANSRTIKVWEYFDKEAILSDFFESLGSGQAE